MSGDKIARLYEMTARPDGATIGDLVASGIAQRSTCEGAVKSWINSGKAGAVHWPTPTSPRRIFDTQARADAWLQASGGQRPATPVALENYFKHLGPGKALIVSEAAAWTGRSQRSIMSALREMEEAKSATCHKVGIHVYFFRTPADVAAWIAGEGPSMIAARKVQQAANMRSDPTKAPKPKRAPAEPWTGGYDPRYQCAPGARPFGAGFAAAGIGRYLD